MTQPEIPDSADWQQRWTIDAGSVLLRPVTRRMAREVLDGGAASRAFADGALHARIPQAMGIAIPDIDSRAVAAGPRPPRTPQAMGIATRDIDSGAAAALPTVWVIVRREDALIVGDL